MEPKTVYTLNCTAALGLIFVYPNYRVNAFGFLPGKEIADDSCSDLNPVDNKYIEQFGGDPKNVSIWGQSAGAGSFVAQVIANGGHATPKLFTKALASSPFWPKTYKYDAPQAQWIYDTLANLTNCIGPNSLQCLKTVDVQTLRTAALYISGSHTYNSSSYTWAPVIDGHFIQEPLSQATAKGAVNIDYGLGMYNLHEGENFVPSGLQTATDTGSPPFNSSLLYPASGTVEELTYNTSYVSAGLIYGDTVLACPTFWMAGASHKHAYLGDYTIDPARHSSDTEWLVAPWNQVNFIQQTDPLIYDGYAVAFASFFQTGDPNAHKLTNASQAGVPESRQTNEEFVIEADGIVNVPTSMLKKRCDFWRSVADETPE